MRRTRPNSKQSSENALPARTGSRVPDLRCTICEQPIPIETAKTDDNGHPIHEECYLLRVRLKRATDPD